MVNQVNQTFQQIPPPQQHPDFIVIEMPLNYYELDDAGNLLGIGYPLMTLNNQNDDLVHKGIALYYLYGYIQKYSETVLPFNLEYFVLDESPDAEKDENDFYPYRSNKSTVYINKNGELDDNGYPLWVQALPQAEDIGQQNNIQGLWDTSWGNPLDYKWFIAYPQTD